MALPIYAGCCNLMMESLVYIIVAVIVEFNLVELLSGAVTLPIYDGCCYLIMQSLVYRYCYSDSGIKFGGITEWSCDTPVPCWHCCCLMMESFVYGYWYNDS